MLWIFPSHKHIFFYLIGIRIRLRHWLLISIWFRLLILFSIRIRLFILVSIRIRFLIFLTIWIRLLILLSIWFRLRILLTIWIWLLILLSIRIRLLIILSIRICFIISLSIWIRLFILMSKMFYQRLWPLMKFYEILTRYRIWSLLCACRKPMYLVDFWGSNQLCLVIFTDFCPVLLFKENPWKMARGFWYFLEKYKVRGGDYQNEQYLVTPVNLR